MLFSVAFTAGRNNIKPMFGGITVPMMILLCLFGAIMTFESLGRGKLVRHNGVSNCIAGLFLFGIFALFALVVLVVFFFALWCLVVFAIGPALGFFACFGLLVGFHGGNVAAFTPTVQPIAHAPVFAKLRNRFDLLALRAILHYDLVGHNFTSFKVMFLAAPTPGAAFFISYRFGGLRQSQIHRKCGAATENKAREKGRIAAPRGKECLRKGARPKGFAKKDLAPWL